MKVLVSLAMSNTKAIAESVITSHLAQVSENLAKIFVYRQSRSTKKEWIDEIANKHLRTINRAANNVKTKKGVLSQNTLAKVWRETFDRNYWLRDVRAVRQDRKYLKLGRYSNLDAVLEESVQTLLSKDAWFANNISNPDLEQDHYMAEHLADLVLNLK